MSKFPKFQEPAGTLPTSFVPDTTQMYSRTIIPDMSKMSPAEQFRYRQSSPLQSFIETINSEEGKIASQHSGNWYYLPTKDNSYSYWHFMRSEEPLQPMEQEIAEYLPGTGDAAEVANIGKDISQGNIKNVISAVILGLLPGNWRKILENVIPNLNKYLGKNLGEMPKIPFDYVGSESSVYVGPKRVLKIYNQGAAPQTLEELKDFNQRFINTRNNFPLAEPLRVEGFVKSELPYKYYPVYSQKKVTPLSTDENLMNADEFEQVLQEIDKTMNKYGIIRSGSVYYDPSTHLHMSDLKSSNIGIDENGKYSIIDGDVWKSGGKINGNDKIRN